VEKNMKTVKFIISVLLLSALVTGSTYGMAAKAHRGTLLQALEILQKGNESQRWVYGFFNYHAQRNGTSPSATIADMAPQPDNFLDTVIGGWWIGYRYFVEVQFLTSIGFTSYWHFTSAYRPGKYGDRYSGYGYSVQPPGGFFGLNNIVKTLLYNQEVKSGSYENARGLVLGLKDIFQIFTKDWLGLASDFYNGEKDSGWGIPGAPDVIHDYQTQNSSTDRTQNGQFTDAGTQSWRVPASNWDDVQDTFFNPGANAGQFWYNQFTHNASFDDIKTDSLKQIGYAMHWIADGSTPQHVWNTTDHNHTSFESYLDEQIGKGYKVDKEKVEALLHEFDESEMTTLTQKFACTASPVAGTCTNNAISAGEVALKNLKVNGKVDPTLYAAGDILRWLAEKAVTYDKVLSDDSEETFNAGTSQALTLAVAGEILLLKKATADLYKKKQYSRIVDASTAPAEGIWGYGTFTVNGVSYNQIR
jgi:hypothetical protein